MWNYRAWPQGDGRPSGSGLAPVYGIYREQQNLAESDERKGDREPPHAGPVGQIRI